MLNEQYRMHPMISHFPRTIFYGGLLKDGPNVKKQEYGNPLLKTIQSQAPQLQVGMSESNFREHENNMGHSTFFLASNFSLSQIWS